MRGANKTYRIKESTPRKIFRVFNALFLALVCVIVVIPIWNVIVTSFAEDKDVMGGVYLLIPKSFTLKNYARVLDSGYMQGFKNSMITACGGTALAMLVTVPMGYALSQKKLLGRKIIMKMISITLVFDAGIIPFYILIKHLGLIDSRW